MIYLVYGSILLIVQPRRYNINYILPHNPHNIIVCAGPVALHVGTVLPSHNTRGIIITKVKVFSAWRSASIYVFNYGGKINGAPVLEDCLHAGLKLIADG